MKDQIKEVEELREEHNELYNEITRWATVVIVVIHNVLLNHSGKKITGEKLKHLQVFWQREVPGRV